MNYVKVGAAAGVLMAAFSAGALFNGYRWETKYQALELAHSKTTNAAQEKALKDISGFTENLTDALQTFTYQTAQNDKAQQDLQAILRDVRGTVSGLRGDFSKLPGRINNATRSTLAEYADTCTAVFEELASAGTRLAESGAAIAREADRHSANERLMLDSWPRVSAKPE